MPITVKETLHHAEKVRIGHAAAQMIRDGETIMLDSGTTTAEIARQIRFLKLRSLNVITNALNIAMELANLPHVRLIMIGGVLRQMSYSLAGPPAEQTLRGLHADRLFLGVDGLDPEIGLMTPDVVEAQLNAVMIQVSREVVVVADASKFQRRSLSVIAKLDAVHKVITDSGDEPGGAAGAARPQRRGHRGLTGGPPGEHGIQPLVLLRRRHHALLGSLGRLHRAPREERLPRHPRLRRLGPHDGPLRRWWRSRSSAGSPSTTCARSSWARRRASWARPGSSSSSTRCAAAPPTSSSR